MTKILLKTSFTYCLGYIYLIIAQITVAVCVVGAKFLLDEFSLVTILMVRYSIGMLFLLFVCALLPKRYFLEVKSLPLKKWSYLILQALCAGAFFNLLLLSGLKYINASEAGIITSALPAVVIVFSIIAFKEQITRKMIVCVCLAMIGLIIINTPIKFTEGSHQFLGRLIVLLSLIPEASYYVLTKKYHVDLHPMINALFMNIINVPVFIFMSLFQPEKIILANVLFYSLPFFILGLATALFYVFWLLGSKTIKASAAGLTTGFMPISTMIMSYFLLGENITITQTLGMLFIISGIMINSYQNNNFSVKKVVPIE